MDPSKKNICSKQQQQQQKKENKEKSRRKKDWVGAIENADDVRFVRFISTSALSYIKTARAELFSVRSEIAVEQ